MALFNKFFQSTKQKNAKNSDTSTQSKHQTYMKSAGSGNESFFPFSSEQVRILLFRECDWTGRRLLFDSNAIQKVNVSPKTEARNHNKLNGKVINNNIHRNKGKTVPPATFVEVCDGYGYTYDQTSADSNSIGEMIFGSVAMSFKGTSLKVHWLPDPKRILCSQIFLSPTHTRHSSTRGTPNSNNSSSESTNCDLSQSDVNSVNSFSLSLSLCVADNSKGLNEQNSSENSTIPLDVPASPMLTEENDSMFRSYAYSGYDSGYCGTDTWRTTSRSTRSSIGSMFSTDPSGIRSRKLSIDSAILVDAAINGQTSDGCLQRRVLRNMSTSFENSFSKNDFIGYFDDNDRASVNCSGTSIRTASSTGRRYSEQYESKSNPEMVRKRKGASKESLRPPHIHFSSYTMKPPARRSKIGLAVCITFSESAEEEMHLFCSEHIALLESMMCRLRAAAETAYINQKKFYQVMLRAWFSTASWITDLFTAPRLHDPVWLSLSSGYSDQPNNLAKHFMVELCWLLNCADTKDTNFFISTLLTAILTNHLGWVGTVAPTINNSANDSAAFAIHQSQTKMSEISKFHPYNVLWAQLGDLYGAIGNPSKLSKTIVCGAHTITINKVLNILTYFVRCGEIKRISSCNILERDVIEGIISDKNNQKTAGTIANLDDSVKPVLREINPIKTKGLSRTKTCVQHLTTIDSEDTIGAKNDIPNVYAFNDSRFVQQELRIGNVEMDTGMEMSLEQKLDIQQYKAKESVNTTIKLMVTSPNNDRFECEAAAEAIDFVLMKIESIDNDKSIAVESPAATEDDCTHVGSKTCNRLWNLDPVRDGISIEQWQSADRCKEETQQTKTDISTTRNTVKKESFNLYQKSNSANCIQKPKILQKNNVYITHNANLSKLKEPTLHSYPSLSDLLTANSMGNSGRLTWGIEPVKEIISMEEEMDFAEAQKRMDKDRTLNPSKSSVVFVLGDNEVLSGLKTPPPSPVSSTNDQFRTMSEENSTQPHILPSTSKLQITEMSLENGTSEVSSPFSSTSTVENVKLVKKKKLCTHKKHSGVKFNFEQYPQIVTNYMKNKNLDITSYDFLEKGLKLEQENALNGGASSTSVLPMLTPDDVQEHDDEEEEEECECCANTFRILQTPSNATELEFSNDDGSYPVPIAKSNKCIPNGNSKSIETSQNNNKLENNSKTTKTEKKSDESSCETSYLAEVPKQDIFPSNSLQLITLPIPKTKIIINDVKNRYQFRPGFVPSLFVGITDHFISDMVLQGTTAPLTIWENDLKQNLTLASHCATFEQKPTENVAIIANIDKWDVKLISSQTYALSSDGDVSGPIGMSQLVSTMLETVHAMWMAGTSAYQCMSFLESKLKEIYLQSETLAAFLLATEFCSLNTITSALNLSANDVPLLLSIASIHSPQVTKKYGISFR